MSTAWNEYSDQSDNEQEDPEPIVNDTLQLLFLRKYSFTNLSQEELIVIFKDCNFKDVEIQKKINDKIKNQTIPYIINNKPLLNQKEITGHLQVTHEKNHKSNKRKEYCNRSNNNRNNKHYDQSNWDKSCSTSYYKPSFSHETTTKKHYYIASKEKDKNSEYYDNNKKHYNNYNQHSKKNCDEFTQIEKELCDGEDYTVYLKKEIEKSHIITKTFSTTNDYSINTEQKDKEILLCTVSNSPKDIISELSPKQNGFLTSIDNSHNYICKESSKLYESKLFPGVFFNKPIVHEEEIKKKRELQYLKNAYNYYTCVEL